VGCLLFLPSQSTLLQSSHGFLQDFFALLPSHSGLKHFQHHFSALILFEGNWGAEIARTSCADLLLDNKAVICKGQQQYWAGLN